MIYMAPKCIEMNAGCITAPEPTWRGGADPDRKLFLLVLVCKVDDLATRMSKHSKIPLHSEH